jgi:hypothetical protein
MSTTVRINLVRTVKDSQRLMLSEEKDAEQRKRSFSFYFTLTYPCLITFSDTIIVIHGSLRSYCGYLVLERVEWIFSPKELYVCFLIYWSFLERDFPLLSWNSIQWFTYCGLLKNNEN